MIETKRSKNNVNVYIDGRLDLHLDVNNGIYTAVNDHVRISAKIEYPGEDLVKFSNVSLRKMNSRGKMVKNTSQKWIKHYTSWLEYVCKEYGLL